LRRSCADRRTGLRGKLQDEIARLIETHPQLKGARDNVAAADEGIDSAFAAFLPSVDLSADFGREITDSPGTRSDRGGSLTVWRESASLTISQTVFDGFGTPAALATAKIGKSIAEVALNSTQQNLLFAAISAYLDVLRNTRLLEVAGANESTIQRQLKLEDERVKRGAGIAIDVLQAKLRLQVSKERRVAFEGNLANATARYQQTFDSKPEVDDMSLPTLPIGLLPETLDEAEVIARAENPALDNSNRAIDRANQRKRSAKSAFYPVIELVTTLNYEQDEAGTLGTRYDGSVKLEATWEIFSGSASAAARRACERVARAPASSPAASCVAATVLSASARTRTSGIARAVARALSKFPVSAWARAILLSAAINKRGSPIRAAVASAAEPRPAAAWATATSPSAQSRKLALLTLMAAASAPSRRHAGVGAAKHEARSAASTPLRGARAEAPAMSARAGACASRARRAAAIWSRRAVSRRPSRRCPSTAAASRSSNNVRDGTPSTGSPASRWYARMAAVVSAVTRPSSSPRYRPSCLSRRWMRRMRDRSVKAAADESAAVASTAASTKTSRTPSAHAVTPAVTAAATTTTATPLRARSCIGNNIPFGFESSRVRGHLGFLF